jgi:DNA-binding HxlR family transcriptional regulator
MHTDEFGKVVSAKDCPIRTVFGRIGDKWSALVIIHLGEHETLRFNELHSMISDLSQKVLTGTLKALEADGLISRKIYPEVPPKVEYSLTDLGKSLLPAMNPLIQWSFANMPTIIASRAKYGIKK